MADYISKIKPLGSAITYEIKDANAIPKSIGTAKGDIIYWSAANTPARLGIGTDGYYLSATNGAPAWTRKRVYYGTCDTAAATAEKAVTCADYDALTVGDIVVVKFANTNSAAVADLKLNVNSKGAKPLKYMYNNAVNNIPAAGYLLAQVYICHYDGTNWVIDNMHYNTNSTYYIESVYTNTAAGTAAKVGTSTKYTLEAGKYFQVLVINANTAASALTLNINSKGAKPIYINGAASSSSNYTLPSGYYLVYYDGTNYYFRTDGKMTGDITGNAATATKVNNNLVIKLKSGTTEGTDLYTFNGSAAKTLDILQGTGITLTAATGSLTIANAGVTGVKGNSESSYRTGQVNLTPANILGTGTTAQFWRGDNNWSSTLAGSLTISKAGEDGVEVVNSQATNPHSGLFGVGASGNLGIYDRTKGKWVVYSDPSGNVVLNGNANTATAFSSNASVTLTGDVTGSASSTKGWSVATTLANSGVTAGSYGPSANAEPGYGVTFDVPYITVDAKGRVTSASTKTVKIPASDEQDHRDEGYGKIAIGTASTATTGITANTNTINARTYNEKFTINPGNKWIALAATDNTTTNNSDTITIAHSVPSSITNSGPSTQQTPGFNATFNIPVVALDAAGHVTGISTTTVKIPAQTNLSGGSAAANDATVVGGVTVSNHAVTVAKKTMTASTGITIAGATDKVTFSVKTSDLYWADQNIATSKSYNTTPEVANIKINGDTSATAASTKNVQLVYDTSLEVLNFVFS